MNSIRSLFSVLILFSLVLWTGCGESPTGGTETTGKVQGRVVSSADPNTAVSGATVRIEGTDLTAVTSADGTFSFDGVGDGDVRIVIDAPDGSGYESSEIEVSVHGGGTVDLDVSVLPNDLRPERMQLYPADARIGILEEARFWVNIWADWLDEDGQNPDGTAGEDFGDEHDGGGGVDDGFVPPRGTDGDVGADKDYPYLRPTWSIKSNTPIGVISREGTFIGTAVGRGTIVATFSSDLVATAEIEVVADGDVVRVVMAPGYYTSIQSGLEQYVGAYAISGAGTVIDDPAIDWSLDPDALGVLEPLNDLTPEQEEEILRSLPFYYYEYLDDFYGPNTDEWYPEVSWEELVGKVALAKFTAAEPAEERIEGTISATLDDVNAATQIHVVKRGVLEQAYISPDEIRLHRFGTAFFSAWGVNQYGTPLEGLEYEWRIEPADFGVFADFDEPGGPGDDFVPPRGDNETGGPGDGFVPPHGDHEPGGSDVRTATGDEPIRPNTREAFRYFSPEQTGEGEIVVTVHDPVSDRSVEMRASVHVEGPPQLIDVIIEPERIEIERGHEIPIHAFAVAEDGDVVEGVKFDWIVTGNVGDIYEGPRDPDFDSTFSEGGDTPNGGGEGEDNGSTDPWPPDEFGFSMRFFVAGEEPGEGSIVVEAYSADGIAVRREVPVLVR